MEMNIKQTEPDEQQAKGRVRTPWYLGVLALLGIGIGSYFYVQEQETLLREEQIYRELADSRDPADYEAFLLRSPHSAYGEEVRRVLADLQQERSEWLAAARAEDRTALSAFAEKFPRSIYLVACKQMLDSLDWADVRALETPEACETYLIAHPQGRYAAEAKALRDRLQRLQVSDGERGLLKGMFNEFLSAWASRDEERLSAVVQVPMDEFMGTERASTGSIMHYADTRLYAGADVRQVHLAIGKEFAVSKNYGYDDELSYSVSFELEETLDRTDLGEPSFFTYTVKTEVTDDYRLKRFSMKKRVGEPKAPESVAPDNRL